MNHDENHCPYCGGQIFVVHSSRIYGEGHDYGTMQVCENWPDTCDAYASMGAILANAELRALRQDCHDRFDQIWKSGERDRNAAYKWMAYYMRLPRPLAHISQFDEKQCNVLLQKLIQMGY